jgi:hypothetical protein
MASLFWVGGTANYDGVTNHFATTTGGAASVAVVSSADTVTFDSNSGTGTVTCTANWSSGSLTFNQTGLTLTTNGTVTFTVAAASTLTLTNGTINTNGSTCSWGFFALGAGTKTLTLGASVVTITGTSGTPWNASTNGTNFTLNAGTSTITDTANASTTFAGNAKTYNNVSFTGSGTKTMTGANTFNNLTRTSNVSGTNGLIPQSSIVVNGVLTSTGTNTATNAVRILISPAVFNASAGQVTITVNGSYSLTNTDFHCINAAGTAALPWTGSSIGDGGNNTNITTDAARDLYWFGSASNWSTLNRWFTATNGGGTSNTTPLPQDNCFIDANSGVGASQSFSNNMRYLGRNVDFTGVPNAATLTYALGGFAQAVTGNLTWASGMTLSSSSAAVLTMWFDTRNVTLTSAGISNSANWRYSFAGTGSITLADNLNLQDTLTQTLGTLNANNKNVTCLSFTSAQSTTRVINMGSGTWTLTGTGTVWTLSGTGLTFNANASTIVISDTSVTGKNFAGFSQTYNNISITGGGTGNVQFTNSSTFNNMTLGAPKSYIFGASTTQTYTTFNATGTAGNLITITSSTPGTQYTFSKPSGIVSADYLSLTDSNATGGASWYAGANSTSVSNNTGWIFTAAPSGTPNLMMMGVG